MLKHWYCTPLIVTYNWAFRPKDILRCIGAVLFCGIMYVTWDQLIEHSLSDQFGAWVIIAYAVFTLNAVAMIASSAHDAIITVIRYNAALLTNKSKQRHIGLRTQFPNTTPLKPK